MAGRTQGSTPAVVGELIKERAGRFRSVDAYGEMVNVLNEQGRFEAALRLEELWNGLLRQVSFNLYCAYRLNPFDPAHYRGKIQRICRVHTHLLPDSDEERFNSIVGKAILEVLGTAAASRLGEVLNQQIKFQAAMPRGAVTLLWLREKLPSVGDMVLLRAQELSKQQVREDEFSVM